MRRVRRALLTLFILLLILFGAAYMGYSRWLLQPIKLAQPQTVVVKPQTSFGYVAGRLQARGLIPSAAALRLYARLTGQANKMKVGEYEVTNGQRPVDILDMLVKGKVKVYWMTVPEGKWASEIKGIIGQRWPQAAQSFLHEVEHPAAWTHKVPFPIVGDTLEGYLFPDTYRFPRMTDAEVVVGKMLERFQVTCWKAYQAHPPANGRSLHDVLVLASLVEAEAKWPAERPIIAGVYMNRLRKGMLLQCDATVLYARHARLKRVLNSDLTVDSPYNTYKYPGLPPGPICNPGQSSFEAALQPAQVSYLYYVAKGDGSHVFSDTLAEHNAAIAHIRGN